MSTGMQMESGVPVDPPRRRKRKTPAGFTVPAAPSPVAAVAVEADPLRELDEGAGADAFVTGEKIPRRPTGRAGWFIDGR